MLEWLELACGAPVHVMAHTNSGKCGDKRCTQIMATMEANLSDLALHRGFYVGDQAAYDAGIENHWHVGKVDMNLVALRKDLYDGTHDIFTFTQGFLLALIPCLAVLMGSLSIFAYMHFYTDYPTKAKLEKTIIGYFHFVAQQSDGSLALALSGTSKGRAILLLTLVSSMLCLNIYEAQMAAKIATTTTEGLTLERLNSDGIHHDIYLRKEQQKYIRRNVTAKLLEPHLLKNQVQYRIF